MKSAFNILVAGHRPNRLPGEPERQEKIRAGLAEAIAGLETVAAGANRRLRLLVGDAEGTDQWARELARERRLDCLPFALAEPGAAAGIALFSAREEGAEDFRHYAALDETKLFYADMLLIVWDGAPPAGAGAGAVRLLIESVRQRKPVLWVNAIHQAGARDEALGALRWFDFSRLDAREIALLDANEGNVGHLHRHFSPLPHEAQARAEAIAVRLKPYLDPEAAQGFEDTIRQWDPHDEPLGAGRAHSAFLRLFGYPRIEGGCCTSYSIAGFEPAEGASSAFWETYHALDRAAVKASHVHRDQVVLVHLFAAFAVLCAVAGNIGWSGLWGVGELLALLAILFIVWRDRRRGMSAHQAYLSLRHGAETFRMLALLQPFCASLPALERGLWTRTSTPSQIDLRAPQIWLVLRRFRDHLPLVANGRYTLASNVARLKTQLAELIEDQRSYHEKNFKRWHGVHHRIEQAMKWIFFLTLIAVLAHLFALVGHFVEHHGVSAPSWLFALAHWIHEHAIHFLLVTASGPAFAASLHGIASKLEIARLAKHSKASAEQLANLKTALDEVALDEKNRHACMMTLRGMALQTVSILYAEHETWRGLLDEQELTLPA